MPKLPAARSNCKFCWQDLAEQREREVSSGVSLWGERLESAFLVIGIFGMFRLRRRIRSDSAQHDRG
jgi:hypothetical protein